MTASSLVLDTSDLETAQAAQKEAKEAREEALQALKKRRAWRKSGFPRQKGDLKECKEYESWETSGEMEESERSFRISDPLLCQF